MRERLPKGVTLEGDPCYSTDRCSHLDHKPLLKKGFPECMIPCLEAFYDDAPDPVKAEIDRFYDNAKKGEISRQDISRLVECCRNTDRTKTAFNDAARGARIKGGSCY